eukprot:Opistho-2@37348
MNNTTDEGIQAGNAPSQYVFSVEKTVQKFLAAGADITMFESSSHRTPVHIATSRGLFGVLSTFMKMTPGAAHQLTTMNQSCLHLAIASVVRKFDVRLMMARLLVEKGAEPNGVDAAGDTPLHLAVTTGQTDIVEFLLLIRAEPYHWDAAGRCPIHLATLQGRTDIVEKFCVARTDINVTTEKGETALILAIRGNFLDIVRLLAMQGARVSHRIPVSRESALHLAVLHNQPELISALIFSNPDIAKILDQNGESAEALCKRMMRYGDNDERAPIFNMLRVASKAQRTYAITNPQPLIPVQDFCVDPSSMQSTKSARPTLDMPTRAVRRASTGSATAPSLPPRNAVVSAPWPPVSGPAPPTQVDAPPAYENADTMASMRIRAATTGGMGPNNSNVTNSANTAAMRARPGMREMIASSTPPQQRQGSMDEPFYEEAISSPRTSAPPSTALPQRPNATTSATNNNATGGVGSPAFGAGRRAPSQVSLEMSGYSGSPAESVRPSPSSFGTDEERRKKRERIEKDRTDLEDLLSQIRAFAKLIEGGVVAETSAYYDVYQKIRRAVNLTAKLDHRLVSPGPKEIVVFLVDSFAKAVVSGHAVASPVSVGQPPLSDKGVALVRTHGGEGYTVFWRTLGDNWN